MAAWSGRPTLAALYAHDVPTVPAMNTAISGRLAGRTAVDTLALHHDLAGRMAFEETVRLVRQTRPRDYKDAFERAAFEELAELNLMFPTPEDEGDDQGPDCEGVPAELPPTPLATAPRSGDLDLFGARVLTESQQRLNGLMAAESAENVAEIRRARLVEVIHGGDQ